VEEEEVEPGASVVFQKELQTLWVAVAEQVAFLKVVLQRLQVLV
jgi:hypothetical protein